MESGAITSYIDVAQLTLYTFWACFAGLIYYLRREDKREGFPMVAEVSDFIRTEGWPHIPSPKTFVLAHGAMRTAPHAEPPCKIPNSRPTAAYVGAPIEPVGNPLLSGIGPAAYAERLDEPDMTFEGEPKIVPLRAAHEFSVNPTDPDPRGLTVVGADGMTAGTVQDVWVDKSEYIIRYYEVALEGGQGSVLVPMPLARINLAGRPHMRVLSILGGQFADVPRTRHPDQITFLEEDKICAYYGGGTLYAEASRQEPIL